MGELWEISDLVVDYDPHTLERRPVSRSKVVSTLRDNGQRWAARIAEEIPSSGDILDPAAVDEALLRAHAEIQRLSEEFCQERRTWLLLPPLLQSLRERGISPIRVVDVGCGIGYVIRHLAREHNADDIEWIGVDLNQSLVGAARRLAAEEDIDCQFHHTNAFSLDRPAHIFLSSGLLHHFRGEALNEFFAEQRRRRPWAFFHFDIQPSWASPIGAFLFHRVRCIEALSRHDGYCSALRAHGGEVLRQAADDPEGEYFVRLFDNREAIVPVFRVMHAVVGVRRELQQSWQSGLGRVAQRLGDRI